jgi:hypothetical protein
MTYAKRKNAEKIKLLLLRGEWGTEQSAWILIWAAERFDTPRPKHQLVQFYTVCIPGTTWSSPNHLFKEWGERGLFFFFFFQYHAAHRAAAACRKAKKYLTIREINRRMNDLELRSTVKASEAHTLSDPVPCRRAEVRYKYIGGKIRWRKRGCKKGLMFKTRTLWWYVFAWNLSKVWTVFKQFERTSARIITIEILMLICVFLLLMTVLNSICIAARDSFCKTSKMKSFQ